MSAYLSPILSSGDSTPAENLVSGQSVPLMLDECSNVTGGEYPVREFKVADRQLVELDDTPARSGHKRQANNSKQVQEKRKKTSSRKVRSMGNSILNDSSNDDDDENENDECDDIECADYQDDEYQSDRLKFTASQQQKCSRHKSSVRMAAEASNETQQQKQQQQQQQIFHQPHQCLADQFLSMTAKGNKDEQHSTRSSFLSSDSEVFSGNNLNGNNINDNNQFQKLFRSAACNQQKLNKKFKQILQSIPVVPLVATTSIMTIILLCLLLLSDSLHLATALRSQPVDLDDQQQQQQHSRLTIASSNMDQMHHGPLMQSLVMDAQTETPLVANRRDSTHSELLSSGDEILSATGDGSVQDQQLGSGETPPSRILSLRRELIGNLLAQQHQHQQQDESVAELDNNQQQRGHHHAPDKRHPFVEFRAKSKRRQANDNNAGLFDSLGSILFGVAGQQQQQQQQQRTSEERSLSHGVIDDEELAAGVDTTGQLIASGGSNTDEDDQTGQLNQQHQASFVLDGEPHVSALSFSHRPALLRSSALELDLSPDAAMNPSHRNNQNKQQRARLSNPMSASHLRQQQQQHMNKHPHHQPNESPMIMSADLQQQQQQQLQLQQQANENTMANNNHERKFDVPQIQCNNTEEGFERFACPTPDELGRYRCIEDRLFCDGYNDCPHGEDEERVSCMYYRLFVSHIDILTNSFLTWMKSQNRQAANNINNNQHHHKQQLQHLMAEGDA